MKVAQFIAVMWFTVISFKMVLEPQTEQHFILIIFTFICFNDTYGCYTADKTCLFDCLSIDTSSIFSSMLHVINDLKRWCFVSWVAVPYVWTLMALTRNPLAYLTLHYWFNGCGVHPLSYYRSAVQVDFVNTENVMNTVSRACVLSISCNCTISGILPTVWNMFGGRNMLS